MFRFRQTFSPSVKYNFLGLSGAYIAFLDDEDSSKLSARMWTSVMQTLTIFLQSGHQQTLLMASPVFIKTWQVIAGKSSIQDLDALLQV